LLHCSLLALVRTTMIHLETPHLILKEAISSRFSSTKNETVDVRVADFDNTQYHVSVTAEERDTMFVSMSTKDCAKVLEGSKGYLEEVYGDMIQSEPLTGFDFSLKIDLTSLPEDKDELIVKIASLKRNVMAAPFMTAGMALAKGAPMDVSSAFEFREGEYVYVVPLDDRVVIIYDMAFKDPTDFAIAKVFLQEFNEVRRLRELASAPYPSYSPNAPGEVTDDPKLKGTLKDNPQRIGYVSFAFQKRHLDAEHIEKSADHMVQFRSYIQYHIKCSKSYMHTRMRLRVNSLLQVLNRAIPDPPKDQKKSKTASGRTFKMAGGAAAGL